MARPHQNAWRPEEIAYLREHYATLPTKLIIEHLGRTYEAIRMEAQRQGIAKVERGYRYRVDSSVFNMLGPSTAYALGFILADGCINARSLQIDSADEEILRKLRGLLGATHPIATYRSPRSDKPCFRLSIRDDRIVEKLAALGVTPRKSLTARIPDVPDALFFHFIRGYFDGNGNAHLHSSGSLTVTIVSGSAELLQAMAARIVALDGPPGRPVVLASNRRGWLLKYHGPRALHLSNLMYADAVDLCLPRKRDVFERYRARIEARTARSPR